MIREPKEIIGLPLIATTTGRQIGTVKALLFEPGQHLLYGYVVNPADKSAELLIHRQDVRAIGDSAVTVENEEAVTVLESDATAKDLRSDTGLLKGLRILTEDGNEIGKVDTLLLEDDGSIVAYRTASGFLGLGHGTDIKRADVVSAGADAIVVSASSTSQSEPSKAQ